jgi:CRISPR-associated protein Cas5t
MIGLRITVPMACWRKPHAREFLESERLPSPATCYGALLSFVGEVDRYKHQQARVTAGLCNQPQKSTILRTMWRIKSKNTAQGTGENARPDFQQLMMQSDLTIFCDSREEKDPSKGLEARVREAFHSPGVIERFGGWSLGESTHLINDAWFLESGVPSSSCQTFLTEPEGNLTLPRWVDHVGAKGTRYAVGRLVQLSEAPPFERLPLISAV